jgi:integrase
VTVGNKRRNLGLGGYPEVTLAIARDKARHFKGLLEKGIDPVEERKAKRRALINSNLSAMTFAKVARKCHRNKALEFKSEKHANDWISSVNRYAIPILGDLPVSEIELPHILSVLEPIWAEKTETATRVRQRIESILTWATVSGHRRGDNPARWRAHLDAVLPKPSKIRQKKHFPALPWQEIGGFMRDLRKRKDATVTPIRHKNSGAQS